MTDINRLLSGEEICEQICPKKQECWDRKNTTCLSKVNTVLAAQRDLTKSQYEGWRSAIEKELTENGHIDWEFWLALKSK